MVKENIYVIREAFEPNCLCCYRNGSIGLKMTDNTLTGDEFSEYLSDAIAHEHIHKILGESFNYTVSKLFDAVEHHFRNHDLHEKEIANRNLLNPYSNRHESYQTYIKIHGFDNFLRYYSITQEDIIYVNLICNCKANKKFIR